MKKALAIILISMAILNMGACNGNNNASGENPPAAAAPNEVSPDSPAAAQEPNASPEAETTPTGNEQPQTPSSTPSEPGAAQPEFAGENQLIVYFTATGNTKTVAETLAAIQSADIYEIVPEEPYTDEDLNYSNRNTRATLEQNDDGARPAIAGAIGNIADYDVIYVGFPIWWGGMPRILYTFFDTYDLSGKTIAPFCTSGGSGISGAVRQIAELEPFADIREGLSANTSTTSEDITQWLNMIGLGK